MSTVNSTDKLSVQRNNIKNSHETLSPSELEKNINMFNRAMQDKNSPNSDRASHNSLNNSADSFSTNKDLGDKGMKEISQIRNSNLFSLNTEQEKKEHTSDLKNITKEETDLLNSDIQQKDSNKENSSKMSDLGTIFSSLMSGSQSPTSGQVSATLAPTDTNAVLDKALSDGLVEKILVSDPKFSNTSEVRIILSQNSVLSGTEIVLKRAADGLLAVEINARNSDQHQRIVGVRNEIIDSLEKHEKGYVKLVISNQEERQSQNQEN